MSAHSPGPWYFHNNAAGYDELRSPNGEVIAMWGDWPALTKADAEVIRAAPEMLALLREMADGGYLRELVAYKIVRRGSRAREEQQLLGRLQSLLARIDGR